MKVLLCACVVVPMASGAFAQTPNATLDTPTGHELSVSAGSYAYREPGPDISIHGPKIGSRYTGTLSLNARRHWFAAGDVGGRFGNATYDGACAPWLIKPNSASPNGYELGLGGFSPCSESGDTDWYVEGRGLAGKDFIGNRWALAPFAGLGFRHLSNGTTGIAGHRTDDYLYVPIGLTASTTVARRSMMRFRLEYDHLIRGWQKTRDSKKGGGSGPPTATAPGFTIDGFTDISFAQRAGWALRASVSYQLTRRWSVEPSFVHWSVGDSPVSSETVTFTVNGVTVRQRFGFYEPRNVTNELGVNFGVRF